MRVRRIVLPAGRGINKESAINGPNSSSQPGESARHQVEISIAMARERLLEAHTARALEMIERARGEVPPRRALDIYCRVNGVGKDEEAGLVRRVLARLGSQEMGPGRRRSIDGDSGNADELPRSWLGRIRRRLGGRKNHELRRWVELHMGRTQVELLSIHVDGAIRMIDLRKSKHDFAEGVEFYAERMGIAPSVARVVYFLVLDRLSQLDPAAAADGKGPAQQVSGGKPPIRALMK